MLRSRQGTLPPIATPCTPGSSPIRRVASRRTWSLDGSRTPGRESCWKVDRQDVSQVVAGVRGLQRRQRRDQHAGARQQHERARDLRRREDPQTAIRARRDAHAAAGESRSRWSDRTTGAEECRRAARPPTSARPRAEPEHAGVHRGFERANGKARGIACPRRSTSGCASSRPRPAPAAQRTRLSASSVRRSAPRLAPSAARTRQLSFAADRSRQDQVGHIRARDDEHHRRRRHEHEEDGPRGRRDLFAERPDLSVGCGPATEYASGCARSIDAWTLVSSARAASTVAPGASRPNRSVMRCLRSVFIVAPR